MVRSARSHPGGMPETRECFPQIIEEFWHPCGMHRFVSSFPGISAALRSPAIFWHPSGMNHKPRIKTVRFLHSPKMPDEPNWRSQI